jgi:hypothetical protein
MDFRLDRTSFSLQTLENQGKNRTYWLEKSADERFDAASFLIANAFGIDLKKLPRMDKTVFSIRKLEDL